MACLVASPAEDAPVWKDTSGEYTYRDLRSAIATVGRILAAFDLPIGTPIALLAPNGMFWIASYLAIMAAGMVVVPLPASLPEHEAAARAAWARCAATLIARTETSKARAFAMHSIAVIEEDLFEAAWDRTTTQPLTVMEVDPNQDAAYLFTSGTTGVPRAVRLTHRNIKANTASILRFLPLRWDERTLLVLPLTYVFGASLLHTHLSLGACLVGHASAAFPETMVEALRTESCTGLAGVPSIFNALVRNSSFPHADLPHLRTLQQAGGALAPSVLRQLAVVQPQARLFVMYGQTEATARLSYLPPEELVRRPGSIGRGIPGVSLRVVDRAGDDVTPGNVGEIVATGENVSPGYLNDHEATRRRMAAGVLRTGDMATVDDDGFIYVVDRAEDFIKSRGHRVASADVEAAVMELSDVVFAAAVGIADDRAGERIELAVIVRSGRQFSERDVIAHCRRRLAPYMVPSRVHRVDALPLNANGKVVKREVRELCAALTSGAVQAKAQP